MKEKEVEVKNKLQDLAKYIKSQLPEGMGFTLLAYEFGDIEGNKMLYVSNSNREDVIKAMVEFVSKNIKDENMYGKDV